MVSGDILASYRLAVSIAKTSSPDEASLLHVRGLFAAPSRDQSVRKLIGHPDPGGAPMGSFDHHDEVGESRRRRPSAMDDHYFVDMNAP
jgi:hypothetical protein